MAINYQILYYNLPKKNIYYNTFPKTPLQVTRLLKEIFAGDIPFSMNWIGYTVFFFIGKTILSSSFFNYYYY
jgi:hypothetical protein